MNPPSITKSCTTEDPKNFIDELKKVFEVMYVVDIKRVELAAYQLKNVSRTWFDQWKEVRDDMHLSRLDLTSWSWPALEDHTCPSRKPLD